MTDAVEAPDAVEGPAGEVAATEEAAGRPDRWRLLDERDFLRRSLEDAREEHEAGDLADDDYAMLRRRDERRLAEVEAALVAVDDAERLAASDGCSDQDRDRVRTASAAGAPVVASADGRPSRRDAGTRPGRGRQRVGSARRAAEDPRGRRRRRWLALGGVVLLVAGATLLAFEVASPRLPGQTPTGSIDLSTAQKEASLLQAAQADVDRGHASQALQLYGQVLDLNPKTPVALAEWGWIEWQAATAAKKANAAADGEAAVARAVQLQPSLYAAQYYLGTMQLAAGQTAGAVAHYQAFLDDHPSSPWLDDAAPDIRKAFQDAGQPVPPGVPAAPTTSTSTPASSSAQG